MRHRVWNNEGEHQPSLLQLIKERQVIEYSKSRTQMAMPAIDCTSFFNSVTKPYSYALQFTFLLTHIGTFSAQQQSKTVKA